MSDENATPTEGQVEENTAGEQPGEQQEPSENDGLIKALHAERQTVKELKAELAKLSKAQEKARLESLSETERAIEEAKKAGFEEAMNSVKAEMTRSKVTAAAAAAGFADPADASGFLNVEDLQTDEDVAKAVADLAKAKPYLLKRAAQPLEQGQQGKEKSGSPNDWLRGALGAGR